MAAVDDNQGQYPAINRSFFSVLIGCVIFVKLSSNVVLKKFRLSIIRKNVNFQISLNFSFCSVNPAVTPNYY